MEKILNEAQMYMLAHIGSVDRTRKNENFALYVRIARMKRGLSSSQLAKRVGVGKVMISAIENCIIAYEEIPLTTIDALEREFGISYQRFLELNQDVIYEVIDLQSTEDKESVSASQSFLSSCKIVDARKHG